MSWRNAYYLFHKNPPIFHSFQSISNQQSLMILALQAQCKDDKDLIKTRTIMARPSNSLMNVKVKSASPRVQFLGKISFLSNSGYLCMHIFPESIHGLGHSISNTIFCCFSCIIAIGIPRRWKSSGGRLDGKPEVGQYKTVHAL